jgi:DNA-directed RNA polymerase subunit alpha
MIWSNFERPPAVEIDAESRTGSYARFLAQPFERGWGTTVGNALRRALLASIPGAAVTALMIENADHEFSVVPGVVEDVTDIILNLKKIPFKLHGDEVEILTLEARGAGEVTARQFQVTHRVDILDPDVHVATLSADGHLRLQVRLENNRGYVQADDNQTEDLGVGFIPVDSAHSPVLRANLRVEAARKGRMTNYERLLLEVWTNGTVAPEDALSHAARMVQGHMDIYAAVGHSDAPEQPAVEPEAPAEQSILDRSIESLGLSIRPLNCLKNANIRTLRDLVTRSEKEMVEIRNFGDKSLKEVQEKLEALGLGFGINLDM